MPAPTTGQPSRDSATEEIMRQVPIASVASRLGTDEASAREAVSAALPTLLAGLTAQASDPSRSRDLATAVQADHDAGLLDRDDPLADVDPAEGEKILGHVFGAQRRAVQADLQGLTGGGDLAGSLMPMLAPLVMAYLKKKMLGDAQQPSSGGGGGLGDILGQVLGRQTQPAEPAPEPDRGGGLGDILGSIFGGRRDEPEPEPAKGGGVLDDILDGIRGKEQRGSGLDDLLGSILRGR